MNQEFINQIELLYEPTNYYNKKAERRVKKFIFEKYGQGGEYISNDDFIAKLSANGFESNKKGFYKLKLRRKWYKEFFL